MEEKINSDKKTPKRKINKIHFFHFFSKFRKQVTAFLFFYSFATLIKYYFFATIFKTFHELKKISITEDFNYFDLLPKFLKKFFGEGVIWSKNQLAIFGLFLSFLFFFLVYLARILYKGTETKSKNYIRNFLLDKFRQLPFEEKVVWQKEINILVQVDSIVISKYWQWIYNYGLLVLLLFSFSFVDSDSETISKMNNKSIYFFLFWMFLIITIIFLLGIISFRNKKKHKKLMDKENQLINKEINKSILIDSMGLTSQYREKQVKEVKKNQWFELKLNQKDIFTEVIPWSLLEVYPYLLLLLMGWKESSLYFFLMFSSTLTNYLFNIFVSYPDYTSSLVRINKFLSLPQKNDNLTGLIITKKINSIVFENVYFKYSDKENKVLENYDKDFTKKNFSYLLGESKEKGTTFYFKHAKEESWVLEGYNNIFTKKNINELSGENGTGKSTILYLLLGMLKPTSGQVLINCQGNKVYNLHRDINLKHWREQIVAYAAHDTLIEEGSTGQKQWANIEQALTKKKDAQIFLFDEADNALDKKNQEEFEGKLKELLKKNSMVIYVVKL